MSRTACAKLDKFHRGVWRQYIVVRSMQHTVGTRIVDSLRLQFDPFGRYPYTRTTRGTARRWGGSNRLEVTFIHHNTRSTYKVPGKQVLVVVVTTTIIIRRGGTMLSTSHTSYAINHYYQQLLQYMRNKISKRGSLKKNRLTKITSPLQRFLQPILINPNTQQTNRLTNLSSFLQRFLQPL